MAKNKILATFRVDEDDWEAFKQWSEKRGNSASAEIIRFIESALGKTTLDDMDTVDKKIEAAIESLRAYDKDPASARLVIDGASVMLAESDEQVIDLVRRGQGVLSVVAIEPLEAAFALSKDEKMKVQASIQGAAVRVTGAKRDDLQWPSRRRSAWPSCSAWPASSGWTASGRKVYFGSAA